MGVCFIYLLTFYQCTLGQYGTGHLDHRGADELTAFDGNALALTDGFLSEVYHLGGPGDLLIGG